jgi:hypothetical protein
MYGNLRPFATLTVEPHQVNTISLRKRKAGPVNDVVKVIGTVVANEKPEIRRLKGKSGQALDCGEWKLWGRRPLTIKRQAVALSGERS